MTQKNQGQKANTNGAGAENMLEGLLLTRSIHPTRQRVVGTNIFGGRLITDLFVPAEPRFPRGIAIESKWQDVPGTAEQKLCYVVLNALEGRYPCPVIIVIGGSGFTNGCRSWVRRQADADKLTVFSWEEFASWLLKVTSQTVGR